MEITTSYHQQGREEGIKEGIKEGKREVALAALKKGFALEDIMEITGLDREKLLEIQKDSATAGSGDQ
jgi:predicted transposase/invertase (TIGR01784 family)